MPPEGNIDVAGARAHHGHLVSRAHARAWAALADAVPARRIAEGAREDGHIASSASRRTGVVAAWSAKITRTSPRLDHHVQAEVEARAEA